MCPQKQPKHHMPICRESYPWIAQYKPATTQNWPHPFSQMPLLQWKWEHWTLNKMSTTQSVAWQTGNWYTEAPEQNKDGRQPEGAYHANVDSMVDDTRQPKSSWCTKHIRCPIQILLNPNIWRFPSSVLDDHTGQIWKWTSTTRKKVAQPGPKHSVGILSHNYCSYGITKIDW